MDGTLERQISKATWVMTVDIRLRKEKTSSKSYCRKGVFFSAAIAYGSIGGSTKEVVFDLMNVQT